MKKVMCVEPGGNRDIKVGYVYIAENEHGEYYTIEGRSYFKTRFVDVDEYKIELPKDLFEI